MPVMSDMQSGIVTMPDGSPVSYDGLVNTNFRIIFPKAQWCTLFLQEFALPGISVKNVTRVTPFVDINEIGEKVNYNNFTLSFMVDKELKTYKEIHDWMKRMTVAGTSVGETDDMVLIMHNKAMIQFNGAWPTSITGLDFITNATDVTYLTARVEFNYDYFTFL